MTEKNFDELEVGCFYLTRSGDVVKVIRKDDDKECPYETVDNAYLPNGMVFGSECKTVTDSDLILKIEPPVIVPAKKPEPVRYGSFTGTIKDFEIHWKIGNPTEMLTNKAQYRVTFELLEEPLQ